jgi:inhibitor of KinA sporulation pathway (predicted exonuclease)
MIGFFDIEFTCWENSLETNWSNPEQPPEIIEIGMVIYDPNSEEVVHQASHWVRPKTNPNLSHYCKELTGIKQSQIDQAHDLSEINAEINTTLNQYTVDQYFSWGKEDLTFWQNDSARSQSECPVPEHQYTDLMRLFSEDGSCVGRTEAAAAHHVRRKNLERHKALNDALDLIPFYHASIAYEPN